MLKLIVILFILFLGSFLLAILSRIDKVEQNIERYIDQRMNETITIRGRKHDLKEFDSPYGVNLDNKRSYDQHQG